MSSRKRDRDSSTATVAASASSDEHQTNSSLLPFGCIFRRLICGVGGCDVDTVHNTMKHPHNQPCASHRQCCIQVDDRDFISTPLLVTTQPDRRMTTPKIQDFIDTYKEKNWLLPTNWNDYYLPFVCSFYNEPKSDQDDKARYFILYAIHKHHNFQHFTYSATPASLPQFYFRFTLINKTCIHLYKIVPPSASSLSVHNSKESIIHSLFPCACEQCQTVPKISLGEFTRLMPAEMTPVELEANVRIQEAGKCVRMGQLVNAPNQINDNHHINNKHPRISDASSHDSHHTGFTPQSPTFSHSSHASSDVPPSSGASTVSSYDANSHYHTSHPSSPNHAQYNAFDTVISNADYGVHPHFDERAWPQHDTVFDAQSIAQLPDVPDTQTRGYSQSNDEHFAYNPSFNDEHDGTLSMINYDIPVNPSLKIDRIPSQPQLPYVYDSHSSHAVAFDPQDERIRRDDYAPGYATHHDDVMLVEMHPSTGHAATMSDYASNMGNRSNNFAIELFPGLERNPSTEWCSQIDDPSLEQDLQTTHHSGTLGSPGEASHDCLIAAPSKRVLSVDKQGKGAVYTEERKSVTQSNVKVISNAHSPPPRSSSNDVKDVDVQVKQQSSSSSDKHDAHATTTITTTITTSANGTPVHVTTNITLHPKATPEEPVNNSAAPAAVPIQLQDEPAIKKQLPWYKRWKRWWCCGAA